MHLLKNANNNNDLSSLSRQFAQVLIQHELLATFSLTGPTYFHHAAVSVRKVGKWPQGVQSMRKTPCKHSLAKKRRLR